MQGAVSVFPSPAKTLRVLDFKHSQLLHNHTIRLRGSGYVGLGSEQEALLDFLVLARCRAFVGFSSSSFSFFLPQYKALQDLPAGPSVLVGEKSTTFMLYGRFVDVEKLGPYVTHVKNSIAGDLD